jgi:hypothetical protein
LAKLLTGRDRDRPVEIIWEKKALDLNSGAGVEPVHVDDAVMRLANGKCIYVQVKEVSPSGGWSAKELVRQSVAQQFWQQWSAKEPEDRPRTFLRLAAIGDLTRLNKIADAALCSRTPAEFGSEASSEVEQESAVLAAALGISTRSAELLAFLRCLQAEPLISASDLEARIIQVLWQFREDAPDISRRLLAIVGRSKHAGPDARAAFTRETLVAELRDDGLAEDKLIAAGIIPGKAITDSVWDWYRNWVVANFRSFQVYGLQVDRAVFADLPALFVPLKLAPIPLDRARETNEPRGDRTPSLGDRLSAEVEQTDGGENGREEQRHPSAKNALELSKVLSKERRFALIGGPGAGKTTTLKWLAVACAVPGNEGREFRQRFGLPAEPLIPVYVRFRQFEERVRAEGLAGVPLRVGLIADFLRAAFQTGLAGENPTRERALDMAYHLLESDRTLFLFDGLDEVADEGMRNRLFEAVADLMQNYKAPRIIVTSRPYAFRHERSPLDLILFEPLPLDREGRRIFAHQWYRAVRTKLAAPLAEEDARARGEDLARAAESMPDLSEVPLLLSILALVHFNRQGLPVERATLYDHATLAMLGHWERDPAGRDLDDAVPDNWANRLRLDEKDIRTVVEHLAQAIQTEGGGGEFSRAEAIARISEGFELLPVGRRSDARDRGELLLRLLADRSGLVQERSPDLFAFVHLSFQEYLAARRLVSDGERGIRRLTTLSKDDRHSEVCRFAAAILSAELNGEADKRATSLIISIGTTSPHWPRPAFLKRPAYISKKHILSGSPGPCFPNAPIRVAVTIRPR